MLSLVSVCMNREEHLRRTLPAWLALPGVDEIVLVDWSTREPFDDLLALDPRIRIIRVVDEPRWILSYAFNLGIQHARGDLILKCDADCLPNGSILSTPPEHGYFFSGDWRTGAPIGKTCTNGQCFFTKAQWNEVNGYSEVIRRYGHDDVDFYDRLVAAGHARREITPDQLDFIQHDDKARVANHTPPAMHATVDSFLHEQVHYHEAINVVVSSFMPWGRWFTQAHYDTISSTERLISLARDKTREIPLSPSLQNMAHGHAVRLVTGKVCKIPPQAMATLDHNGLLTLLARHIKK